MNEDRARSHARVHTRNHVSVHAQDHERSHAPTYACNLCAYVATHLHASEESRHTPY